MSMTQKCSGSRKLWSWCIYGSATASRSLDSSSARENSSAVVLPFCRGCERSSPLFMRKMLYASQQARMSVRTPVIPAVEPV